MGYIGEGGENDVFRFQALFEQETHAISQYFGLSRSRTGEDLQDRVWSCGHSFKLSFVELHCQSRSVVVASLVLLLTMKPRVAVTPP